MTRKWYYRFLLITQLANIGWARRPLRARVHLHPRPQHHTSAGAVLEMSRIVLTLWVSEAMQKMS